MRLKEKKKASTVDNFWNDKGCITTSLAGIKKIQIPLRVHLKVYTKRANAKKNGT